MPNPECPNLEYKGCRLRKLSDNTCYCPDNIDENNQCAYSKSPIECVDKKHACILRGKDGHCIDPFQIDLVNKKCAVAEGCVIKAYNKLTGSKVGLPKDEEPKDAKDEQE